MKQFAFPLSVKCADIKERDECIELLKSIGYSVETLSLFMFVCTNAWNGNYKCTDFAHGQSHEDDRYHIDHFNPDLIHDIASACTNDTWQEGEPVIYLPSQGYQLVKGLIDCSVAKEYLYRRPTLSEICEHHGYEIVGKDIKRKEQKPECKHDCSCYKNFEPKEPEYFITDDGVKIYPGQQYHIIRRNFEIVSTPFRFSHLDIKAYIKATFSTREAAEAWVAKNKPFEPVSITLTCNTPEQLRWLWHQMNACNTAIKDRMYGCVEPFDESESLFNWKQVDEACKKAGVKIYKD